MSVASTGFIVAIALAPLGAGEVYAQAPFHLLEATIPDVHRAIQEGQITCRGLVQAYLNRARAYNGTCNQLVTEENVADASCPTTANTRPRSRRRRAGPTAIRRKTPPIEFGRMEPTASDPSVQQQFGMTVGIPNAGQVRALGHDQHPRRALGHLQGRVRQASVGGAAAGRRAGGLRGIPPPAGRARARRGARRAVRPQSRSGGDADVLHPVLVQGSVRHQGHALDRRRRRALRHRFSGARPHAGRAAARRRARSSTPRPTPPNTTDAAPAIPAARTTRPRSCRRRSAISAAPGPAIRATRTTRRAPPRSARARAPASRSARTW